MLALFDHKRKMMLPKLKHMLRRLIRAAAVALAAAGLFTNAQADDRVVVLTSYPEALTVKFERAFEAANPGMRVELLWRQSRDGLAYLREGGYREVDVYWTPSPGNFVQLRDEGRLAKLELDDPDLPGMVGGVPLGDPDDHFAAFELAGFGIAYHREAVQSLGLEPPRDWADLAVPAYAGKVQLPTPARTGFASSLIEAVLQAQGWERGWALLSAIAGNAQLGSVLADGPDPLSMGRIAARMSIDFFARNSGEAVSFVYPPKTAYSPAHVAIMAEAPHPEAARRFVDFVLSPAGQDLLWHADVRRLPVRASSYEGHPGTTAKPFATDALAYDSVLTEKRRGLVAELFDAVLTAPHEALRDAWQALRAAERQGSNDARVGEARRLLESVPVDAAGQADAELRTLFSSPDSTAERAALIAVWTDDARKRIAQARELLAQVQQ